MGSNKISSLRIGIPLIGVKRWLGGVTYVELLVKALSLLSDQERPQIYLVVTNPESLDLHSHIFSLVDGFIFLNCNSAQARSTLPHPHKNCSSYAELSTHIDFYYPVNSDVISDVCSGSWIPDFQHVHLPEFFPKEELSRRDGWFQKIALQAKIVVFSSRDSENDFRSLYPKSSVVTRVLHFYALPVEEWYETDPAEIQKKYNLPDNFFICCNQFWVHKNHIRLFEALAKVRQTGRDVHLVCTGSAAEWRVRDYFHNLTELITRLDIKDCVHILGTIPRDEQIQLIRRSVAVIQPSLFEGWSTVVEDSRALGKTMILSDLPVHYEQAPDHSLYFNRNNADDLAEKILSIFPTLGPGPDASREQEARIKAHELVLNYAKEFCDIALEAQGLCGKSPLNDARDSHGHILSQEKADQGETLVEGNQGPDLSMFSITVATSIAPKNIDNQQAAVASWLKLGFRVISVNTTEEINSLKDYFPGVTFFKTSRNAVNITGKPYIFFDDILKALNASQSEVCGIVNSDIHLIADENMHEFIYSEAKNTFLYGTRIDVDSLDSLNGEEYPWGFDYFFFNKQFISLYPNSDFSLGAPWWDLWACFIPAINNIPIARFEKPVGYHKTHPKNWSHQMWSIYCREFISHLTQKNIEPSLPAEFKKNLHYFITMKKFQEFSGYVAIFIDQKSKKINIDVIKQKQRKKLDMIHNLRIGIPIIGNKDWLGGVHYVKSLVEAVSLLPLNERPRVFLVIYDQTLKWSDLHRDFFSLLYGIIFFGQDILSAKATLPSPVLHCRTIEELNNILDFFFPLVPEVMPQLVADLCNASWIYDFQHVYLPEFFPRAEIISRNATFRRVAESAKLVVLSSRTAEQDFWRIFPESKAVTRVLSFHSLPSEGWLTLDPSETQQKYSLPDKFLICCNQFWMHKNHRRLFEAMADVVRAAPDVHLVCTGSTDDWRFQNFFSELLDFIKTQGLQNCITILGQIPRIDQIQLMRRSLAVIQPSLFEGWSSVVEEARMFGKDIILSDFAVHYEQAPDHAVYFDRHNAKDLAEKILAVLPHLSVGPNHVREKEAKKKSVALVEKFGRDFCDIAAEAQELFHKKISRETAESSNASTSDPILKAPPRATEKAVADCVQPGGVSHGVTIIAPDNYTNKSWYEETKRLFGEDADIAILPSPSGEGFEKICFREDILFLGASHHLPGLFNSDSKIRFWNNIPSKKYFYQYEKVIGSFWPDTEQKERNVHKIESEVYAVQDEYDAADYDNIFGKKAIWLPDMISVERISRGKHYPSLSQRPIDLLFVGKIQGGFYQQRQAILNRLNSFGASNNLKTVIIDTSYVRFNDVDIIENNYYSQAKVVINPIGGGNFFNIRFFETLAAGCICLQQVDNNGVFLKTFHERYKDYNAVYFTSSDLEQKISFIFPDVCRFEKNVSNTHALLRERDAGEARFHALGISYVRSDDRPAQPDKAFVKEDTLYLSSRKKGRPKISIVTPSFNQGQFLEECIDSILSQNYPNLEYIIMDGGSTDNSVDIIKKYEKHLTYWQSRPDNGQYTAINEGFKKTTGEIMTWINSDDILHPKSLDMAVRIFSRIKDVEWIMGIPNSIDEHGNQIWVFNDIPLWSREKYLKRQYKHPYIQQEGTFWRRTLWERAGACIDATYRLAADMELWARFFRFSQLHSADALLGAFRKHSAQKTATFLEEYNREAERIVDREIELYERGSDKTLLPAPPPITGAVLSDSNNSIKSVDETDKADRKEYIRVSAIVSTYNSERFIRGCLEDLVNQTLYQKGGLEIVVVDSGSQQNEKAIVEEFMQRYKNLIYMRTKRETVYAAWNRGIKAASGQYITNANTDDRHRKDALEVMASVLDKKMEIGLVYADILVTQIENETFENCTPVAANRLPAYNRAFLTMCCCIGPQPMWRKSLHEKYGYFDEEFETSGDWEFWLRIAQDTTFSHISECLGLYLRSSKSIEHRNADRKNNENRILYRKYVPRFFQNLENSLANFLKTSPGDRDMTFMYGQVLAAFRKYGKAIDIYSAYLKNHSSDKEFSYALEDIRRSKKSWKKDKGKGKGEAEQILSESAGHGLTQQEKEKSRIRVSAIVSTYNAERFMRGCLEDLTNQTLYKDGRLEIIVVDSGSEQNEKAIVEEFMERYNDIIYIRTGVREGVYAAWNRGIKVARGEYITNANTDDRHRSDALEVMAFMLNRTPDAGLVYADVLVTDKENDTYEKHTGTRAYRWEEFRMEFLACHNYVGPQPMWRKSLHDKHGYFDESFVVSGDWEFWLRIAGGTKFLHIPEYLGLYLASPSSIEHENLGNRTKEDSRIHKTYIPKYFPKFEEYYSSILRNDPLNGNAIYYLGRILTALERYDRAIDVYSSYLEKNPDDTQIYNILEEVRFLKISNPSSPGPEIHENTGYAGEGKNVRASTAVSTYNSEGFVRSCFEGTKEQPLHPKEWVEIVVAANLVPFKDRERFERQEECVNSISHLIPSGVVPLDICYEDEYLQPAGWHVAPVLKRSADVELKIDGKRKPFVTDLFDAAAEWAVKRGVRWFALSNSDIIFTPRLLHELRKLLKDGYETLAVSRTDLLRIDPVSNEMQVYLEILGYDVFICKTDWWIKNRRLFQEYIFGEKAWDNAFAAIMGAHSKFHILYSEGLCLHFKHPMEWIQGPYADYNLSIYHGPDNVYQEKYTAFKSDILNMEKSLLTSDKTADLIEKHFRGTDTSPNPGIKVSAIVSTYNSERFLRGCLEDLVNQTLYEKGELEIIVVNSGSQQNEEAIVKVFQKKYKNILYLHTKERETVYAAWNKGIKAASGRYITNANTDDRHRRDALELLAGTLDRKPGIGLVYADVIITETENETFEKNTRVSHYKWQDFDREELSMGCFIGPQPMWRKSLHDKYGYFDETFTSSGDWEFWLRIAEGTDFVHIPEFLGLYLRSPESLEHSNTEKKMEENRTIYRKYIPGYLPAYEKYFAGLLTDLSDPVSVYRYGQILAAFGRYDEAVKLYEAYLRKHPENRVFSTFLHYMKTLKAFHASPPTGPAASLPPVVMDYINKADAHIAGGDLASARESINQAINHASGHPQLCGMLSNMLDNLQSPEGAAEFLGTKKKDG